MKRKSKIISKFLWKYKSISIRDGIVWFKDDTGKAQYSLDTKAILGSRQFYSHSTNQYYTAKQFARYIVRMNQLKVFW